MTYVFNGLDPLQPLITLCLFVVATRYAFSPHAFKNKTHSGWWRACALLIFGGLFCHLLYIISEKTIDAEGFIHEPFALIPIGFALLFFGMLGVLFRSALNLIHNMRVKNS